MKAKQEIRDSFVLYKSFYKPIAGLTDKQLGRLFRAVFQWQITGEADQDSDDVVKMALAFFTNQFRIDNEKYLERCEKNRTNANTRWEKSKDATASNRIQSYSNECERCEPMRMMPNDNDNDNDNDNGKDNVLGGPGDETPARKKRSFAKPSLSDVEAYCLERNNGIDPAAFLDHYEANGWMVGKNKMRDWKATIRKWERNQDKVTTASNLGNATGKVITDIDELFKD